LKKFFVLVLLISGIAFAQSDGPAEKEIDVSLGIDKILKLDFKASTKIQVGNENILTYQLIPQKNEITLKGLKAGKTSVIIRNTVGDIKARYLVKVTVNNLSKTVQELRAFLGDVEGLEIGIKEGKVYVGGNIVVPADIGKVATVLDGYKEVMKLVQLSSHTQRVIAKKMQEEIQNNGMKDVGVRVVNGVFWLEGVVKSASEKELAMKIAQAFLPDKLELLASIRSSQFQKLNRPPIIDFVVVNEKKEPEPTPKLVKITTQFVELAKDYGKVFGFRWNPLMGNDDSRIEFGKRSDGTIGTSSSNTLSGVITNLFPKLHSAKQAGYARIIQSGVVTVKNKEQGKISKSGNIPYSVGQGNGAVAQQAPTGFHLSVKPNILEGDNIELGVTISVGVNNGQTAAGAPLIVENKVETIIVTKSQESAVVGGIAFNEKSTNYDKDPSAPTVDNTTGSALLTFNRSKQYTSNKSQYVVFVTANIIESASGDVNEIRRKFRYRGR